MNNSKHYFSVATIAGSDSSGGAGIQADIKTISATGCYAASIITALTAQNTLGVQAVHAITPDFVTQQIDSVFSDLTISAVKIGMLSNEHIIDAVARGLRKFKPKHIVVDPVMISKSGCALLDLTVVDYLKACLLPLATLITPNLIEVEQLLGIKIETTAAMESAAISMGKQFKTNILIKGGHLDTPQSADVLYLHADKSCHWFYADRIASQHTHGTGCTLSSAIASYLAQGSALPEAINLAKRYLTQAIQSGSKQRIGNGCGPVDHFWASR